MHVYILATMDTKGVEAAFVRDRLAGAGVEAVLVDTGSYGEPTARPDVSRDEVFAAAGTTAAAVKAKGDRGHAVAQATAGAERLIRARFERGDVAGVLGLGGSAGTVIGTAAMRALPLGVPKLMVSTLASGQTRQYVGEKDILMLNAVVDISGINRISRKVLGGAAAAMAGMVKLGAGDETTPGVERPIVALTMFGVTTPCVEQARLILEAAGYETLVFHATGTGGRVMESLVRDGLCAGVLDITTTEIADELLGGFLSAGPERLTAAGAAGIPQVVSVGATDMVNFYAPDTVPAAYRTRKFHHHDPQVTLMRTNVDDNTRIGEHIARKVAAARGPAVILLPTRGVSRIDAAGQPFDDPAARAALFAAIRKHAGAIDVQDIDAHINDAAFAQAAAQRLIELLKTTATTAQMAQSEGKQRS